MYVCITLYAYAHIQVPSKLRVDSQRMQQADEQVKLAQTVKEKEVNKALKTAADEKDKVCMYVCICMYAYLCFCVFLYARMWIHTSNQHR